ncbi:MAG: nucleotidyltransferase family protein [candidate division KSB1 bacterium]|jgi:NDP-sugar pyrophosphorylase family protein|nr:nucleotidyltransferase family protein [candidate division KSB1 bacterium]
MKAMILAAGFGTRLRPLTDNKPKALVELNGKPILQILIERLIQFGINDIIINAHHYSDLIVNFLEEKEHFNINIVISREEDILGTGGGLAKVAHFFDDDAPFLLHNVDIVTNLNYRHLLEHHLSGDNLATLVVSERETSRYFFIDRNDLICGHGNQDNALLRIMRYPCCLSRKVAFNGIHIISPEILSNITERGTFSIITLYLRLIAEGHKIGAYHMPSCYWKDIGRIKDLRSAESEIGKTDL